MADSFINRLDESTTIKSSDYTVFDVGDPNKGSYFTKKISLDTLSKQVSSDISGGFTVLLTQLQTSINNSNAGLSNKLDKRGLNLSPNEKMSGPLFIDSYLSATSAVDFYGVLNVHDNKIINIKTPSLDTDAANKEYVDRLSGFYVPLSGGSSKPMTGYLYLFGKPTEPNQAANKEYVDELSGVYVPLSGGSSKPMTGYLHLFNDPLLPAQAANKNYVDTQISTAISNLGTSVGVAYLKKSTDSMDSGSTLTLGGDPSLAGHAANKNYVDTTVSNASAKLVSRSYVDSSFIPLTGGTMTNTTPLILNVDPTLISNPKQAATKNYVDTNISKLSSYIPLSGGIMIQGYITAPYDDPAIPRNLVTKAYTDKTIDFKINSTTNFVHITGNDRMTGPLYLHQDPNILSDPKQAATKSYVDNTVRFNNYFVHISGNDTITGPLSVNNTFYVGNSSTFTNVMSLCNKRIINVADAASGKDAVNRDTLLSAVKTGLDSITRFVPLSGFSNVTGPLSVTNTFTVTGASNFRGNVNFNDKQISRFTTLIKTLDLNTDYIADTPTLYADALDTYVLRPSDNGSVLYVDSGGICYIAIPNNLPVGFNLMVIKKSTFTLTFKPDTTSAGIFISNLYNYRSIGTQFGICSMLLVENGRMIITGDLS